MDIVLYALIGAHINAGVAYWICFSVYCAIRLARAIYKAVKENL